MSAPSHNVFAADNVAEKVMRRVEIAKVARNLHDCLAFASFKTRNGWEDRTLRSLEPEINQQLKRKRPQFEDDVSDVPTVLSDDHPPRGSFLSKPDNNVFKMPTTKRLRSNSAIGINKTHSTTSWKQDHQLPQSSQAMGSSTIFDHQRFGHDLATMPHPEVEDSPMFDVHSSDEEDQIHSMHSYAHEPSSSIISSSPPRTPPPTRRQLHNSKHTGADLLLYLANSPSRSPAVHINRLSSTSKEPPSTPPPHHSHLPSSVMQTPGMNMGLFNGALQTPGQNFNLADFCNVTPSPAAAQWGSRTPALSKTPAFARRSLNFDSLAPISPTAQRKAPRSQGLALELGEELMPRS